MLFIKEAEDIASGKVDESEVITEGMFDEIMDDFISMAEKKMKGYSVNEIDSLARRAKSINTEVKKRDVLSDIEASRKESQQELAKVAGKEGKEDKEKELRRQIQVLGELSARVKRFKIADDHETPERDRHNVINLDDH